VQQHLLVTGNWLYAFLQGGAYLKTCEVYGAAFVISSYDVYGATFVISGYDVYAAAFVISHLVSA